MGWIWTYEEGTILQRKGRVRVEGGDGQSVLITMEMGLETVRMGGGEGSVLLGQLWD